MLAALVAGLLLGRASRARVAVCGALPVSLVGAVRRGAGLARHPLARSLRRAGSRGALPAVFAAAAVLAGATIADARLTALDAGVLADMHGQTVETRAVLLEPVRDRGRPGRPSRVCASSTGRARASRPSLRSRAWPRPDHAEQGVFSVAVGDIVAVSGRVAPLGFADAYQRLRNAHAAIEARRVDATGQRRGGLAG